MESNLPVAPKDVETLRAELERGRNAETLFMSIWALERYAFATLEWADTLAQRVADSSATILDLRSQLQDAQEVAQDLVMKAEQWQKQLEWHYEGVPPGNPSQTAIVIVVDKETQAFETIDCGYWSHEVGDWYLHRFGWMKKLPALAVRCWQGVTVPIEVLF